MIRFEKVFDPQGYTSPNRLCLLQTGVHGLTGYYDTEQSQANQSDRFSFLSLQAGGHRFDPGHVHQLFIEIFGEISDRLGGRVSGRVDHIFSVLPSASRGSEDLATFGQFTA